MGTNREGWKGSEKVDNQSENNRYINYISTFQKQLSYCYEDCSKRLLLIKT